MALKSVDYVISFDDETPLNLIKKVMPDILVKGGDYKIKDIVGIKMLLKMVVQFNRFLSIKVIAPANLLIK
ncbi:MAG: hypothetical protein Ct9H90mP15_01750 [Candidatus Neomarinimicrobiota bacterium]|nr:MAG: hypothetical protein Ct9H90mP15_01750 [Candidatus Neomarinimicrobiota bacterium]